MQVSIYSIAFMALSSVVSAGMPVALFIVLQKKYNAKILPALTGAAAFVIFALVLEQIVHYIVFKKIALRDKQIIYIIYGILMAGIFEETARFVSFKILRKKKYCGISTGLLYGVGHGGTEAVLLAGVSMIAAIVISVLYNTGNLEAIRGKLQKETFTYIETQVSTILAASPFMFLVSGIERIFAISIQMSLSVVVFYSVYCRGKMWLFPLAIFLHAFIDIPAAAMQAGILKSVFFTEGLVGLFAVIMIIYAVYLHKKLREML